MDPANLTKIFGYINGLLIPGGGTELLVIKDKEKQESRKKKVLNYNFKNRNHFFLNVSGPGRRTVNL